MASPPRSMDSSQAHALTETGILAHNIARHLAEVRIVDYAEIHDLWTSLKSLLPTATQHAKTLPVKVAEPLVEIDRIAVEASQSPTLRELPHVLLHSRLGELGDKLWRETVRHYMGVPVSLPSSAKVAKRSSAKSQASAAPIRKFWLLARWIAIELENETKACQQEDSEVRKASHARTSKLIGYADPSGEATAFGKAAAECAEEYFPSLTPSVVGLLKALDFIADRRLGLKKLATACDKLHESIDRATVPDGTAIASAGDRLAQLAEQLEGHFAACDSPYDFWAQESRSKMLRAVFRRAGEQLLQVLECGGLLEDSIAVNSICDCFEHVNLDARHKAACLAAIEYWVPERFEGWGICWHEYPDYELDASLSPIRLSGKRHAEPLRAVADLVCREGVRLGGSVVGARDGDSNQNQVKPASAADLETTPGPYEVNESQCQIRVDGKTEEVSPEAARMAKLLLDNNGEWVSMRKNGFTKPSEVKAKLPNSIQEMLETEKGKGYRLKPRR